MFNSIKKNELTSSEVSILMDALKFCIGSTQSNLEPCSKRIDNLDTLMMSAFSEEGVSLYLFKLSNCAMLLDSPAELCEPMYVGTLSQSGDFSHYANAEFQHTKHEKVMMYINDWLLNAGTKKLR